MNVEDFISQLKSLKPGKQRVDFLKQHLQDEFWVNIVKNNTYALRLFRFCCASCDSDTCIKIFDILVQKGCFMRIIQKFDETRVVTNSIISLIIICPQLLNNWFSGPLKFKTVNVFFDFLYYGSKHADNLNLTGNVEQFLKYKLTNVQYYDTLQNILTSTYKDNKHTYNYILKLISEANADMFRQFNSTHEVKGDISIFIQNVPELFTILQPPFKFNNVACFVNMMCYIMIGNKYDNDMRIMKYIDEHINTIQITSNTTYNITPQFVVCSAEDINYYLSNVLSQNLSHTYELLINTIAKNTKYADEIYTNLRKSIFVEEYICKQITKDLESAVQNQMTDDAITTDDIKELFDI